MIVSNNIKPNYKVIMVSDLGTIFTGRERGEFLYYHFSKLFELDKATQFIFDLSGVKILNPSVVNECFSKLHNEHPNRVFFGGNISLAAERGIDAAEVCDHLSFFYANIKR